MMSRYDRGKVDRAEIEDRVVDDVEIKRLIPGFRLLKDGVETAVGPLVQFGQLVGGNPVGVGVEAVEVAENKPGGVADLAVGVGQLLEDLLGAADIGVVVGRGDPQPEDVGAVLFDDLFRGDRVAGGFVHRLALAVDDPAVGADRLIGGRQAAGDGGQEGGLEPAAVLVGALKVEVGRPGKGRGAVSGRRNGLCRSRTRRPGYPAPV